MVDTIEAPKSDDRNDRNLRRQFTDLAHRCELLADAVNAAPNFGVVVTAFAVAALNLAAKAIEQAKSDLFPAQKR